MKFKGWQMVYTGMMMEFSVVGFVFYCFPLMFSELERDLGASQTQLSSALSLFFIFSTLASIFLGRILDKYSIKGIMTLGGIIFSLGLFSIAMVENTLSLLLIYATLIAVGGPAQTIKIMTKIAAIKEQIQNRVGGLSLASSTANADKNNGSIARTIAL